MKARRTIPIAVCYALIAVWTSAVFFQREDSFVANARVKDPRAYPLLDAGGIGFGACYMGAGWPVYWAVRAAMATTEWARFPAVVKPIPAEKDKP